MWSSANPNPNPNPLLTINSGRRRRVSEPLGQMSSIESELDFGGYQLHDAAEEGDVEQIYSLLVPHKKGGRGGGGVKHLVPKMKGEYREMKHLI